MWGPFDHQGPGLDYALATQATDQHTTTCNVCLDGCVCPGADDAYTTEYRAYVAWRDSAPAEAEAYRRAAMPPH